MQSSAKTPEAYLASLPPDRREALAAVREIILAHLPAGYIEDMGYGMIVYNIPLSRYPKTYNKQPLMYAALASQKNYMAVYLMTAYGNDANWFIDEYAKTGKKLDMGKSCVRFKSLGDLPLDLIGRTIARVTPDAYIARYEASRGISG